MPDLPQDRDDEDREPTPANPFAGSPFEQMFSGLAGGDMSGLQAMFGQLQRMFTPHEGTIDWGMARDLARQVVAQRPDASIGDGERRRLADVAQLAEHWLDGATDFPAGGATVTAWSRAEWVEHSMPVWQRLVEPVAASVVKAMGAALPAEAQGMAGPMLGMLTQLGGAMFSQQLGQAIGELSGEVVSASDVGFPVSPAGTPALVPSNVASFGEGLGIDDSDVLLYLVLRECAHQRLYAATPWLRDYLFSAIEDYGRGITIDMSRIQDSMSSLDPSDMAAVQEALGGGLFEVEQSPAQRAALQRLETALALVEGWVDEVVGQAAAVMPHAAALREAMRRRRATGGPAESTFAALVGLELRPRRLRDASTLWGALRSAEGTAARDAVWAHSELLPTAADLDDPLSYAARTKEADAIDVESPEFDAALTALLDGTTDGTDSKAGTDSADGADSTHDADAGDADAGDADAGDADAGDADTSDAGDDTDGSHDGR